MGIPRTWGFPGPAVHGASDGTALGMDQFRGILTLKSRSTRAQIKANLEPQLLPFLSLASSFPASFSAVFSSSPPLGIVSLFKIGDPRAYCVDPLYIQGTHLRLDIYIFRGSSNCFCYNYRCFANTGNIKNQTTRSTPANQQFTTRFHAGSSSSRVAWACLGLPVVCLLCCRRLFSQVHDPRFSGVCLCPVVSRRHN